MRKILFFMLALLAGASACNAKDIAVVTHKSNAVKTIPLADFAKMAKTTRKWADGKPLVFVMKDPGTADMKLVNQKLFGMSADEVKALIVANSSAFKIVNSDAEVIATVTAMPNAIGFLDIYSITGAVNVLKIDSKSPLEPGYLLHGQ
jgi:uncharacterized protein YegL